MADAVLVVLLLAFIWAAVLVPPAAGARASREADFLGSLRPDGRQPDMADDPRFRPALTPNARRRQVLGGLLVALGATLALGLLPTFRLLLVVHLLLLNSGLAYVALLVHVRDERMARTGAPTARDQWLESEREEVAALAALAHQAWDEPAYEDDAYAYAEDGYADAYHDLRDLGDDLDEDEYEVDVDEDLEAEAASLDDELSRRRRLARPA